MSAVFRSGSDKGLRDQLLSASEALMNLSSTARQIVFWLLIIAGALLLYKLVNPRGSSYENVDLTRMDQMIQSRQS